MCPDLRLRAKSGCSPKVLSSYVALPGKLDSYHCSSTCDKTEAAVAACCREPNSNVFCLSAPVRGITGELRSFLPVGSLSRFAG